MKIGYVLFTFPEITQAWILNEIVELINRGHKVYIFSIFPSEDNIFHPEVNEYNLLKNTFYLTNSKTMLNQIKLILRTIGLFGWSEPCESLKYKVLSIAAAKHFSDIAKGLGIDFLHAHFNTVPTHTAMLMSKKLKIPFTFTVHAADIFVNKNVKAIKERMHRASAVITISYYNKDYLEKLTNSYQNKIYVVRACPIINKNKLLKRQPELFRILTIARLIEKKGIKYSILAIKELIMDYPEIKYSIIGSGPLEKELKELAKSLNLQNNINFLGNLSDDSLNDESKKATIFMLPCVMAKNGDMDGIPVALMESMYLGIPVVSTTISGIPELIKNGKEGILVEPKNVEQLTIAMKLLLKDKELRFKIGLNGRKKIKNDFNIQNEINKLFEIWEKVV